VLVTQKECSLSKCLLQVLQANGVHTTTAELPLLLVKKPLRRFSAPPLPILPPFVIIHAQHSPLGGLITKTEREKNIALFYFVTGYFYSGLVRSSGDYFVHFQLLNKEVPGSALISRDARGEAPGQSSRAVIFMGPWEEQGQLLETACTAHFIILQSSTRT
jgi:hypothetical protein